MLKLTMVTALAATLAASPAAAIGEFQPSTDAGYSDLHDDGLLWLRVWNRGYVGDRSGEDGGGGVYPAPHGPANVYVGEFWLGAYNRGKLYVIWPHYGWRGLTPVIMSDEPEWSQVPPYIKPEGTLDSYYRMNDIYAGENGLLNVECDVHTISWSTENQDDFIGFRYYLYNKNRTALENTYLALAYDLDIGGSFSYIDDKVGFDADRSMPYMYDDDEHPYLGILPINAAVRGAYAWDIMDDPHTDREKYALMERPGVDCERTTPYDWRVLLSFGPFTIPPHACHTLTCALVAGMTLEELYANADAALLGSQAGPRPVKPTAYAFNLSQNHPNPVSTATRIAFACPVAARVKLAVYDLAGRRVATLADGIYQPGIYDVTWRPGAATPGVYLYTLEAAGERLVRTMVVAR